MPAFTFSIACDKSCDVDDNTKIVLLGRCMRSVEQKRKVKEVLSLAGQTKEVLLQI